MQSIVNYEYVVLYTIDISGKDFYPFINVKNFKYTELEKTLDGTSDLISIPIGLPFRNSIQTKAFVSKRCIGKQTLFIV